VRCTPVRYAHKTHAHKTHAYEMHARKMHAHEVHAHKMRAREVHAHETPAHHCPGSSLAQTVVDLSRSEFQNTSFCASCGVVPIARGTSAQRVRRITAPTPPIYYEPVKYAAGVEQAKHRRSTGEAPTERILRASPSSASLRVSRGGCYDYQGGVRHISVPLDHVPYAVAIGVKKGVKSGGFWQPLSQDVALWCNWSHSCLAGQTLGASSSHFGNRRQE
jgi:hypothetical protein